jgi:hypothetical protein
MLTTSNGSSEPLLVSELGGEVELLWLPESLTPVDLRDDVHGSWRQLAWSGKALGDAFKLAACDVVAPLVDRCSPCGPSRCRGGVVGV